MDPAFVAMNPGEMMEEEAPHEGEEFGFVLSGGIELSLGGVTYRLGKGECFYFRASKRHRIANRRKTKAMVLWVSSPPNF
jgi:mannose-6-phosphate isomerase-like protein (cupin superfamily)